MKTMELICGTCDKAFHMKLGEYRRQRKRGRELFFCGLGCAAKHNNLSREDRVVEIKKICPWCKKEFQSSTSLKASTFCSRECASSGSMTDYRRAKASETGKSAISKQNLISPEDALKMREAPRYVNIKTYLEQIGEPHEFEYRIDQYIYDLVLINKKIIIEFDEAYHQGAKQKEIDSQRDIAALYFGWKVFRVAVENGEVFDKKHILPFINQ